MWSLPCCKADEPYLSVAQICSFKRFAEQSAQENDGITHDLRLPLSMYGVSGCGSGRLCRCMLSKRREGLTGRRICGPRLQNASEKLRNCTSAENVLINLLLVSSTLRPQSDWSMLLCVGQTYKVATSIHSSTEAHIFAIYLECYRRWLILESHPRVT